MILDIQAVVGTAIVLLALPCSAKHSHGRLRRDLIARRNAHMSQRAAPQTDSNDASAAQKRSTQCAFPTNAGLVPVTPTSSNAGWAMSPDQSCTPGSWCPYACPPGQVGTNWNPKATSYSYPDSMDGGLYCNEDGTITLPSNGIYCTAGTGAASAVNNLSGGVAFCQTVLPGNEAMLIPTLVDAEQTLAIPGSSYWCETAAHYYINPPGITTEQGCVWGDETLPHGNWAPYVAGGNTDANGETFLKIGWNPIFTASALASTLPTFGIEITCPEGTNCNGLPCKIDPSAGLNSVTSSDSASGAGGGDFCVVTVPSGGTANFVLFEVGGSNSESSSAASTSKAATSAKAPTTVAIPTSTVPASTTTPTSTPTPTSSSTQSSIEPPSSSSSSSPTPTPTPTPSSASPSTSHSSSQEPSSSSTHGHSVPTLSTLASYASIPTAAHSTPAGIFFLNATGTLGSTASATLSVSSANNTDGAAIAGTSKKSAAHRLLAPSVLLVFSALSCLYFS